MNARLLLFVLVINSYAYVSGQTQSNTLDQDDETSRNIDELRKHLFTNYDKHARPVKHHSIATNTSVGITAIHVDVDELRSIFTLHGWVKFQWSDDRLLWDPEKFGGLKVIRVPDHQIWQPDVLLYNSADGSDIDRYGHTHSLIYNTGTVLWVPPTILNAFCDLNLRNWPSDEHKCRLKFGSWTYDGFSINLTVYSHSSEPEDPLENLIIRNTEWEIVSINGKANSTYYKCCPEPYHDVTFNIIIKRSSSLYTAAVILPGIVVAILTQILFFLPPNAGEKTLISGASVLISLLMLLFLGNKLPPLSDHTPLIVIFYGCSLILGSLSVVITVFTIRLSRLPLARDVPHWLSSIMHSCVGRVLGFNAGYNLAMRKHQPLTEMTLHESDVNSITLQESSATSDWFAVAMAIDRFTFIIYNVIFGILCMLIL